VRRVDEGAKLMTLEEALFWMRDGKPVVSKKMMMRFRMEKKSVSLGARQKQYWFIDFQHCGTKFPEEWIRWHSANDDFFDLINDDTWELE
jgi:hypothetical protein